MIWIYVAATIFGGSFLIPMLLGGLASDVDADFGGDLEVDADIDFDAGDFDAGDFDAGDFDAGDFDAGDFDAGDFDGGGFDAGDVGGHIDADGTAIEAADGSGSGFADGAFDGALGAIFSSIVSFRTVVFFLAFFGAAGLVFGALGYGATSTFGTAVLVGLIAAVINSTLFGLLKHSQPNSQISDRTLEGRWARVVLPMSLEQRGRIRIDLSGQPQYLVAKPVDDGAAHQFDIGTSVVVVKVENGTALVSSVPELESGEET